MAVSHELITTARRLANLNVRRPRQADLKRAVSTAYYAMFHTLARDFLAEPCIAKRSKGVRRSRPA